MGVADVITRGGLPYRDIADNKPQRIYVLYTISKILFGETILPIRILTVIVNVGIAGYLIALCRTIRKQKGSGWEVGVWYLLIAPVFQSQ